jgi:hypothetical protein
MSKPTRHDADILLRLAELSVLYNTPAVATFVLSDDFPTDFARFRQKFPRGKRSDEENLLHRFLAYFELAGTLYRNGLISGDLMFDWMDVTGAWDRVKGYALGLRQEMEDPSQSENFEYAAEQARSWKPKRP